MDLFRCQTPTGPQWAVDGKLLHVDFHLSDLLAMPVKSHVDYLRGAVTEEPADGPKLAPIEAAQEVWASGVTFLRSRQAREAESAVADVYQRVYTAERPELFFKAPGWRVIGPGGLIRVRRDSQWSVPEPELTLVINYQGEICGYTAGNDVSSRDIEGENPLYLPQAKIYNGACALGPCIRLIDEPAALRDLPIRLSILRGGQMTFEGQTSSAMMKRAYTDLAAWLFRELDFPQGAFLLTGAGIVPPESFTLQPGDEVRVEVGELLLANWTA